MRQIIINLTIHHNRIEYTIEIGINEGRRIVNLEAERDSK